MVTLPAEFPRFDFEDGNTLLQAVGSFWAQIFEDRDRLKLEFDALGALFLQTHINFLEAVDSLSRLEVPVFHTERLFLFKLKKSARVTEEGALKYGDGTVYGPQPGTGDKSLYGEVVRERFTYSLGDSQLADVATITNRILDPSLVLTKGVDYTIDRLKNTITFVKEPFDEPLLARRPIYGDDNEIADEEVSLILFNAQFDRKLLFNHFGYVINVSAPSSQFYKDFINAFWNALNRTLTLEDIRLLLGAITGIPSTIEDGEVVEFIETSRGRLNITTNRNTYRFKDTAVPTVSQGDTLRKGQELVNSLEIVELSGSSRDLSGIKAIALGQEFISNGFFSHLIFKNEEVPLDFLGIDSDGRAFVRFDVGGFQADVDRFWENAQSRGKVQGKTLAELLDTRANPPTDPSLPPEITQPGPEHLPPTINPLEFVVDNLLKNNLFLIRLIPADIDPEAMGLQFLHTLRRVMPPHTTFLVLMETEISVNAFDLSTTIDTGIGRFSGPDPGPSEDIGVIPVAGAHIQQLAPRPRVVETT